MKWHRPKSNKLKIIYIIHFVCERVRPRWEEELHKKIPSTMAVLFVCVCADIGIVMLVGVLGQINCILSEHGGTREAS